MMSIYAAIVAATIVLPSGGPDSLRNARVDSSVVWSARFDPASPDTQPRPKAINYSDWYARRLTIHRIGSYTMLPMFAAEYVLGNQLIHGNDGSGIKPAHVAVATGIGALFTVNTVTGLWNLWDSRADPAGRKRRTLHALTMLAADAGFVWTGAVADGAKRSNANARRHRNVALGSIGVATIGTAMMWLWKD